MTLLDRLLATPSKWGLSLRGALRDSQGLSPFATQRSQTAPDTLIISK